MKNVAKVVTGLALTLALVGCTQEEKSNEIELFKMYDSQQGTFLLDPKAEEENVILVEPQEAKYWGVDDLHHGTKVIGIFDEEGWELLGIKEAE